MTNESATVDETTFIGGGYAFFKTGSYKMAEENPILVQMIMAAPMLAFDIHISDEAINLMEMRAFSPVAWPWKGPPQNIHNLFPHGINWYHYGLAEAQTFGRMLVYDLQNNAERILFWSRIMMMIFTLSTTVFIFYWACGLAANDWAGVMGALIWACNPISLAYGHLAITDPGIALMYPLALWWFNKSVDLPTPQNIILLGVICAIAMQMKFLALILAPTFMLMLLVNWIQNKKIVSPLIIIKSLGLFLCGAWLATLIVYFPHWNAPPFIDADQASSLAIPHWFQWFRPILIPGDFFKAVALKVLHSQAEHGAYLCGEWSKSGWWYYYPVTMLFKTPLPILGLIVSGAFLLLSRARDTKFAELVPWIAVLIFVASTMVSTINIGVRHMLPVYPLLAVGIANELMHCGRKLRITSWLLCAWLIMIAVTTYPNFISYTNVFGGGMKDGYKVLIDSNYDWGQDAKRLKRWMEHNKIDHVFLDFFGTQTAIEWYQIPNTRITANDRNLNGWVVVSVSQLMRPEWAWLRESHVPDDRIGYTLFAYQFP